MRSEVLTTYCTKHRPDRDDSANVMKIKNGCELTSCTAARHAWLFAMACSRIML